MSRSQTWITLMISILSLKLKHLTRAKKLTYSHQETIVSYHSRINLSKIMFGNIGFPELLVILVIALLVFGPKKLPEVGRSLGKALREFRKTSDEIKEKIEEEIHAEEFKDIKEEINKQVGEDEEGKKFS